MAEIPSYAKEQIEKTDLHEAEKAEVLKVVSEALDVYMEAPEQHQALEQCVTLVRLSVGNDSGKRLIIVPIDVAMATLSDMGIPEILLRLLVTKYSEPHLRLVLFGKDRACNLFNVDDKLLEAA